jgi:serine/tyrosine/threonine adenylyltransferase
MTGFLFDNSYARLPEVFFRTCEPTPVAAPALIRFNHALAAQLGYQGDADDAELLAQIFSGNQLLAGSRPIATAYAGHQFGGFNPRLGDGRAVLLGEVVTADGQRRDIQLKGAGRTPFSRGGDGRSPLGPVLREYLVSEAMHALGVATTRALAAVTTGERVYRDKPLPGAILTRVAASHIRVGTFQFFASQRDIDSLKALADHVIERHFADISGHAQPYLALLQQVVQKQAELIAHWMSLGFIHGVMNTDNVLVSGETIDYGPCAFMDSFHPETVFSSIDAGGRYAYQMQPAVGQWNMARFAETLLPLIAADQDQAVEQATAVIRDFVGIYDAAWLRCFRAKLGLREVQSDDRQLIEDLLDLMAQHSVDFTLLFRSLQDAVLAPQQAVQTLALFHGASAWQGWAARWSQRLELEQQTPEQIAAGLRDINPAVIPRNHRIEQAIQAASEGQDFSDFQRLNRILSSPFLVTDEDAQWMGPPQPSEKVCKTFCGT